MASGWSPLRFAKRSALGHRRGQTLALLAVSALVTACTAFAPVYDRAMQQALVDTLLAHATPAERAVTLVSDAQVNAGGATASRDPRELEDLVPAEVSARLGPPVLGRTASVTPDTGEVPPAGPLLWREGACEHVRLLSGDCPDAPGEILVSEPDVENFDLAVGKRTTVRAAVEGQPGVRLEVVGTYADEDDPWWQGQRLVGSSGISQTIDPSATHDAWLTTEETFVAGSVLPGQTAQTSALIRTEGTGVDELLALGESVHALTRDVAYNGRDLHVLDELRAVTDDVRAQTLQAHRTVPLLMAPMAVLAIFVLWLVLGAATEQRRGEVAVARLRGRGPAGAVALLLTELLPVLLLGVIPGAVAALAGGTLARSLLPGAAPFEAGAGFAVAVVLAAAAVALTTVVVAVRVAREPLDDLLRRGRVAPGRWALGVTDAFLIAGAGTGVLAFATGSLSGPFALAGPALLALLVGLLLAHLGAPTSSAAGRRLLRRGKLVSGVTLLEMGRRRDTRAVIVVITVASALAVFALDALVVGERNRTNASEHDAGAPVVLRLDGRDLDGVRAALADADPAGLRATPVMIARTTLAVEPEAFRRIAFFPRGGPTLAQWAELAPPDRAPVELTGSRISLDVRTGTGFVSTDAFNSDAGVDLGFVVTTATGTRLSIRLGTLPPPGEQATLGADEPACATGCRLAAIDFTAPPGVAIAGDLALSDLQVDRGPVDLGSSPDDWNANDDDGIAVGTSTRTSTHTELNLTLGIQGFYPVELAPSWVPRTIPALVPAGLDADGLVVTGVDGSDRPADPVGRLILVPAMPERSALVDLDAISRGAQITNDAHAEVWLVDDPALVTAVTTSLRERGIPVESVRRVSTIRQSYDDTVATWSLGLGGVVGPAALLIALLVLLVLAVTGWRERARDLAILRLNGVSARTVRRLATWAQLPAILLAVLGGVGAGLIGAALAMPDVLFFPVRPETPVVDPANSWSTVLLVAVACASLLPAGAALAGRAIARRARLSRVREAG